MIKKIILILIILLFPIGFFIYKKNHHSQIIFGNEQEGTAGMVWISGGEFMMGCNASLAKANERPAHKVKVHGFWIDQTDVTNAQFATFVKETGYITTAERKPDWNTLKVQLPPGTRKPPQTQLVPGALVFVGTDHPVSLGDMSQWWRCVPGANWRHPLGPHSNLLGKENHPVVQVSYEDALAYATWAKKRLPTEAEWEYAARGGLEQKNYCWGDEFKPWGKRKANTFAGTQFPIVDPKYREKIGTTPVKHYPPNGYGLYDMAGNVWQWVADWYRADAFSIEAQTPVSVDPHGPHDSFDPDDHVAPEHAPKRVIRGGSFLCDEHVCMSYRPSARRGVDPYTSMNHIGFRTAKDEK